MNKVRGLKIYPEPILEESIINREHWSLIGEPLPDYRDAVAVTCELKETFLDKILDNVMLADKLRSDMCKVLDDLGMDYSKATRTCVKKDGARQLFVFHIKD